MLDLHKKKNSLPPDLSRYFKDDVLSVAEVQYAEG